MRLCGASWAPSRRQSRCAALARRREGANAHVRHSQGAIRGPKADGRRSQAAIKARKCMCGARSGPLRRQRQHAALNGRLQGAEADVWRLLGAITVPKLTCSVRRELSGQQTVCAALPGRHGCCAHVRRWQGAIRAPMRICSACGPPSERQSCCGGCMCGSMMLPKRPCAGATPPGPHPGATWALLCAIWASSELDPDTVFGIKSSGEGGDVWRRSTRHCPAGAPSLPYWGAIRSVEGLGGGYSAAPVLAMVVGVVEAVMGGNVWCHSTRHRPPPPCGLPRSSGEGRPLVRRPAQAGGEGSC